MTASPPAVRLVSRLARVDSAKRTAGARPIAWLAVRLLSDRGPARWP